MTLIMKLAAAAGALLIATTAEAAVVEPFAGAMRTDWSQGIGAPDPYGATAPDGSPGWALSYPAWAYNSAISFAPGQVLTAWFNPNLVADPAGGFDGGGQLFLGFAANAAGAYSLDASSDQTLNTGSIGFQANAVYGNADLATADFTWADQWYLLAVVWAPDGGVTGDIYDADGVTLLESIAGPDLVGAPTGIALAGYGGVDVADIAVSDIPEPGAAALLLSGVAGLVRARRRTVG